MQILQHDIESKNLPFPDEYFDTVLMIAVIEHLLDPISALIEIHRILKNGGKLLVNTPNIAKWTRRLKLLFGYFPSTASIDEGLLQYKGKGPTDLYDEGHLHYFTWRSLSHLLTERAGFSNIVRHGYVVYGFLSRMWPTMFSDIMIWSSKNGHPVKRLLPKKNYAQKYLGFYIPKTNGDGDYYKTFRYT